MRRVGALLQRAGNGSTAPLIVLESALAALGWVPGRTVTIDVRWGGGDPAQTRADAKELVALRPDVLVAFPSSMAAAVLHETRTIPVVFADTTDPVGLGFVRSLAHPGGNATGYTSFEISFYAKWLETIKEIAPNVTHVLAIFSPDPGSGGRKALPIMRSAAESLKIAFSARFPRNQTELLAAIGDFAREPDGALLQLPDAVTFPSLHAEIGAAARYRLPAIYYIRDYADAGGLMFYGPDEKGEMSGIASYIDRILRGANPGDLPVQNHTQFDLVINLKTAKALGLNVPQALLLRTDDLIK